ncbi:MAG: hypothetical protein ACJAZF_003158 [Granulosicoccus sp.]
MVGGIDLIPSDLIGEKLGLMFCGTKVLLELVDVSNNSLVRVGTEKIESVLLCKPNTNAEHDTDCHKHKQADGSRQHNGDRHPPVPS